MQILLIFILFFCVINTLFLIAIAGTVSKLFVDQSSNKEEWSQIIKQRSDQIASRPINYTEQDDSNWDGVVPLPKNSDGLSIIVDN